MFTYPNKKETSTGRSMVEMLGVLAVIGILSIASLSGMTYLKEKNIANQITKEALTQAAEIKARAKQFVDGSGEIQYARGGESLYIFSRKYGSAAAGKTTLILSAKMRDENEKFNPISKSLCQKMISKEKVGIFNCIAVGENTTECSDTGTEDSEKKFACGEENVIVFITDATTTVTGTTATDPCLNVECSPGKVCYSGFCQCPAGKVEDINGNCVDACSAPEPVCNKTAEQLSAQDINGCPIWENLDCTPNDCNLKSGKCCPDGKKYYEEIEDCCLNGKYAEKQKKCCGGDDVVTSDGYCCLDTQYAQEEDKCCPMDEVVSNGYCCPKGQTYNETAGMCCGDYNTSAECCYALKIKDLYTTENMNSVQRLIQYKNGICQCADGLLERTEDSYCVQCNSNDDCEECLLCSDDNVCSGTKEFAIDTTSTLFEETLTDETQYKRTPLFQVSAASNCSYSIYIRAYIDDMLYFESQKGNSCYEGNFTQVQPYHRHCINGSVYTLTPGDTVRIYAQDHWGGHLVFGSKYTTTLNQQSNAVIKVTKIDNKSNAQYGCSPINSGKYCITFNNCACLSEELTYSCHNSKPFDSDLENTEEGQMCKR